MVDYLLPKEMFGDEPDQEVRGELQHVYNAAVVIIMFVRSLPMVEELKRISVSLKLGEVPVPTDCMDIIYKGMMQRFSGLPEEKRAPVEPWVSEAGEALRLLRAAQKRRAGKVS